MWDQDSLTGKGTLETDIHRSIRRNRDNACSVDVLCVVLDDMCYSTSLLQACSLFARI